MSVRCNWRTLNSLTLTTSLASGPTISVTATDLSGGNPFAPPCFYSPSTDSAIIEATARNPIILANITNPGYSLPTPEEQWQNCFVEWLDTDPLNSDYWTPLPFANPNTNWCARVDSPCGFYKTTGAFRKPNAGPIGGKYLAKIGQGYVPAYFGSAATLGELECFDYERNFLGTGSFSWSYT